MTHYEESQTLNKKLGELIHAEREITNEILSLINIGFEKRAYLDLGFSSMFDWLTRGFGYSNGSAQRRIEAARFLKAVPVVAEKLEKGEVTLSTVSRVQSVIREHEKNLGERISPTTKLEVLEKVENKTIVETEKILLSLFPDVKSSVTQERHFVIDPNTIRHSMNLSTKVSADLKRAKEILSHVVPNGSDADVIAYALNYFLDRRDPLRKTGSGKIEKGIGRLVDNKAKDLSIRSSTLAAARRLALKASEGACTFREPLTGRRCNSHHQVQIDHIKPKALGGTDGPENLRALCRQHNLLMAERAFGKEHMNRYRSEKLG